MSDDRIGTEFAGFRIESVLGQGGMGTVYLAEQSSPRRRIVLKLLRPELSEDDAFRRRFVHESEAAASTEHPNIVPIYAAGEADGALYIAMRYVEGDDLRDMIAVDGPLPPDRAIEVVSQVASALDAAHARGLVHRDVKPSNILLDGQGNAYLSDFGLIKRSEVDTGLTKTGQFMGSIEYCAPEQIRGDEVDRRADVYSLGCVLFEAIVGRPPFKRETEIATLYAHLEQTPPALSSVAPAAPRDLDVVVSKALAKRPSSRYPTAGAFARDARHATGASSGEREAVHRRARRWGIVLAALAIAGVLVAVALLTGGNAPVSTLDETSAGSIEGADTVARLDPETGEVVQTVGGFSVRTQSYFSNGLAVGEGGVWVGSGNAVTHVDPVTGTVRATISIIGARQTGITLPAVAFRTVWVSTGAELERINPATDALLKPISVFPVTTSSPGRTWVATGEDRVWVAAPSGLVAVDPVRSRVVLRVDVPDVTGLAVGEGSVWIVDDLSGELLRFDSATGERTGAVSVPGNLDAVAAGGGGVWILDKGAGTVVFVDPDTMDVTDTVRVSSDERDIVFGGGGVWLADGDRGSVGRIDPETRQFTVFPVGGPARLVAVGSDPADVWALVQSAAPDRAAG